MSARLPRRRFIASIAAPAVVTVACARRARLGPEDPIVIVGAGLAGLQAADLIRRAGKPVIVLEASASPGGRVRTLRGPFSDGLYGEAGASRIANTHARVMRLAAEHRLPLTPFAQAAGSTVVAARQWRWRLPEDLPRAAAALALAREEKGLAPAALLRKYVGDTPDHLTDAHDAVAWPAWLASRGASSGAVTLMTLGGDSRGLSARYVLQQMALLGTSTVFFRIDGGMDRLVRAFANRMSDIVRYNSPVMRVEQSSQGVSVGVSQAGRALSLKASRVIFANPFSTLRHIDVRPTVSAGKARVIAEMPYYQATRVLCQCRTRFWEGDRLSGAARTDDPAEIWDATPDRDLDAGVLTSTSSGDARRALVRAFPRLAREIEREAAVSWATEPWARGAFAVFHPGQMTAFASDLSRPEGRLHFAGEHTSRWSGWMEGALESGERVASEVLR